jgi:glycerophosphoryl diester phosphodiesterase
LLSLITALCRTLHRQSAASSGKDSSSSTLIWLIFTIIAASLIFSYLFLPSLRELDTNTEQQLDSEHELYTLYHEPSPHFCSLIRRPLVCAHGGDLEFAAPNTLAAFQAALEAGADCVEVDVSMTKDGQLVAVHDRDLAALFLLETNSGGVGGGGSGTAAALIGLPFWNNRRLAHAPKLYPRVGTWHQLSKLQWQYDRSDSSATTHSRTSTIALVQDVLELILSSTLSSQEIAITLDIKLKDSIKETQEAEVMAQAVYDLLKATNCGQYCMTWSKSDIFVAAMKNLDTRQRVGLVVLNETNAARTAGMHEPLRLKHVNAEVAGVHYRMVTVELITLVRKAKMEIYIWTANTAAMMKIALDAGPDAVVTSYPRKLLSALHARAVACARVRRKNVARSS